MNPKHTKRIYISGPMEGKRQHNKGAFKSAEKQLERMGHSPVNPFDLQVDPIHMITANPTRQDFYRKDVRALTYCDGILMLKGWNMSHGAQFERYVAIEMGLTVHYEDEIENGELRRR